MLPITRTWTREYDSEREITLTNIYQREAEVWRIPTDVEMEYHTDLYGKQYSTWTCSGYKYQAILTDTREAFEAADFWTIKAWASHNHYRLRCKFRRLTGYELDAIRTVRKDNPYHTGSEGRKVIETCSNYRKHWARATA